VIGGHTVSLTLIVLLIYAGAIGLAYLLCRAAGNADDVEGYPRG
jgi:hypothetical protein